MAVPTIPMAVAEIPWVWMQHLSLSPSSHLHAAERHSLGPLLQNLFCHCSSRLVVETSWNKAHEVLSVSTT